MEEADKIMLISMRDAKCVIPKEITSIRDFTAEVTYEALASAVRIVAGEDAPQFPKKLSPSVGVRHRVCTTLGSAIKELGYRGEIGYSQILYPAERDLRRILQFIVDKLPKTEEESSAEATGPAAAYRSEARRAVGVWRRAPVVGVRKGKMLPGGLRTVWGFRAAHSGRTVLSQCGGRVETLAASLLRRSDQEMAQSALDARAAQAEGGVAGVSKRRRDAVRASVRRAFGAGLGFGVGGGLGSSFGAGVDLASMVSRVRASAALGALGGSAFLRSVALGHDPAGGGGDGMLGTVGDGAKEEGKEVKTEEDLERERAAALAALEAELEAVRAAREAARRETELIRAAMRAKRAALREAREAGKELEREYTLQKKALEMLPEAEKHAKELQEACDRAQAKIETLAQEWEQHRQPLLAALRRAKDAAGAAVAREAELRSEAARLRGEMPGLAEQVKAKETEARAAKEELERTSKEAGSRTDYTRRILDIVASVRRQQAEIDHVVGDIREVQNAVSQVSGKLARTGKDAEETIHRAVRESRSKDASLTAYRHLTSLREMFAGLVDSVDETAKADTELRRLEAQADELDARVSTTNRERILRDLAALKAENEQLQARIDASK